MIVTILLVVILVEAIVIFEQGKIIKNCPTKDDIAKLKRAVDNL